MRWLRRASGNGYQGLARGLLIEDRRILLPWGARRYQLLERCQPDDTISRAAWDELHWQSPITLNGLPAQSLQIVLYPYGWFDMAWVCLQRGSCPVTARSAFQHAFEHLARTFGKPAITLPPHTCSPGERFIQWERDNIHLALILRLGEAFDDDLFSCIVHVSHKSVGGCAPQPH